MAVGCNLKPYRDIPMVHKSLYDYLKQLIFLYFGKTTSDMGIKATNAFCQLG